MAPKRSKNPGKTSRYYQSAKGRKSYEKQKGKQKKINSTAAKRKYRRDLLKIKPCPKGQDKSHKIVNGKKVVVCENTKKNRARGGAKRR
tara:strand:+ start:606 stop:872 length:267 start_codon:yes stop_codon:yes gene_type:complete